MHRWLFEVEGGHGRTLRTRRRIEDTRPSGADPVSVFDAARGSHRVTQKNRSSELECGAMLAFLARMSDVLLMCGSGAELTSDVERKRHHDEMEAFFL